ncbi:MAG: hypothetical protein RL275_739 [Chloroflexota bacterium]|jgi:hypothetical protein
MTEQWMPGSKEELLSVMEHEWNLLVNLTILLTDEQMTHPDSGGWSPKDNLAHLAEWMNILMGYHMDRKPAHEVIGTSEEVVKGWDMEIINPVLFNRNKDRSRSEVMTLLKTTYEILKARLEATPFDDLLKPRHANDPKKRPLLLWVLGDTTEHFQEHRETMERGIKI